MKPDVTYPSLDDVDLDFEPSLDLIDSKTCKKEESDHSYTFETHPFYSQIGDLSDVEMPNDGDAD